jgi:hypothetical protein
MGHATAAADTHQISLTLIDMILPLLSFLPCARVLHSTWYTTAGQQSRCAVLLHAMQQQQQTSTCSMWTRHALTFN